MNRKSIFPAIILALLVSTNAASSQEQTHSLSKDQIKTGTVTKSSPTVNLKDVGKQVAPGVIEVNPESISGKQLIIPNSTDSLVICIGKRLPDGTCKGIFIGSGPASS